ncbi:MAG: metalloregulator ArsR/SmtB family transcription factor [Microbacterium sp.]
MDELLVAIGDPHRRTFLDALSRRPATVNELAELVPIARPGVSRHLRILREAGLVDVLAEGQRRIYSLRTDPLVELDDWLAPYRAVWMQRMDALHTEISRGKKNERSKR